VPARLALAPAAAAALLVAVPAPAHSAPRLLDGGLLLAAAPGAPALALALAADDPPPMDFDLLGEPPPPPPAADVARLRKRQRFLGVHQAAGIGLYALQLTTTTVGTLHYFDKFADGPNTERWRRAHTALAYTNLALFAATGAAALLAPTAPGRRSAGLDRVNAHRLAMLAATVGMVAQGALGIYTARREGYTDQERIATVHLAVGYATLAALTAGVAVLVF
jgi:hypothetical protein